MFGKKSSFNSLLAGMLIVGEGSVRVSSDTQIDNTQISASDLTGDRGVERTQSFNLNITNHSAVTVKNISGINTITIADSFLTVEQTGLIALSTLIIKKGAHVHFSGDLACDKLVIEKGGTMGASKIFCPAIDLQAGGALSGYVSTFAKGAETPEVSPEEPNNPT